MPPFHLLRIEKDVPLNFLYQTLIYKACVNLLFLEKNMTTSE